MVRTWVPNTVWLLKYVSPGEETVLVGYVSFTKITGKYLEGVNPGLRKLGARPGDYKFGIHFIEGMRGQRMKGKGKKGEGMFRKIVELSLAFLQETLGASEAPKFQVFASCYADNVSAVAAFTSMLRAKDKLVEGMYHIDHSSALFKLM